MHFLLGLQIGNYDVSFVFHSVLKQKLVALLVSRIYSFLISYGCAFNLFFTALDAILINQISSHLHRQVIFIDLPRISFKGLKQLIDEKYSDLESKFKALIIPTCGHPRNLYVICEFLNYNAICKSPSRCQKLIQPYGAKSKLCLCFICFES